MNPNICYISIYIYIHWYQSQSICSQLIFSDLFPQMGSRERCRWGDLHHIRLPQTPTKGRHPWLCGTKQPPKNNWTKKGMGRKILNKHEHFQLVVFSKLPAGGHLNLQGTSYVIWRFSTTSSTSKGDLIFAWHRHRSHWISEFLPFFWLEYIYIYVLHNAYIYIYIYTRWWFEIFSIFTPACGNGYMWLLFFKWVETTTLFFLYTFSCSNHIVVTNTHTRTFTWGTHTQTISVLVSSGSDQLITKLLFFTADILGIYTYLHIYILLWFRGLKDSKPTFLVTT